MGQTYSRADDLEILSDDDDVRVSYKLDMCPSSVKRRRALLALMLHNRTGEELELCAKVTGADWDEMERQDQKRRALPLSYWLNGWWEAVRSGYDFDLSFHGWTPEEDLFLVNETDDGKVCSYRRCDLQDVMRRRAVLSLGLHVMTKEELDVCLLVLGARVEDVLEVLHAPFRRISCEHLTSWWAKVLG
jgi:hypothetical protein